MNAKMNHHLPCVREDQSLGEILDAAQLKKVLFGILRDVHSFCERNGIRYCLYGGTLLGAIRHKGFIPWDDDIDIAMPRPDYERFCETYSSDRYSVHTFKTDPDYLMPFAKVCDDRTVLVENRYPHISLGVNLDVFPLDGVDSLEDARRKEIRRRNLYFFLDLRNVSPQQIRREYRHWFFRTVQHFALRLVPNRLLVGRFERDMAKTRFEESPFRGCVVWGYGVSETCPASVYSIFEETKPFESGRFHVQNGWHEYLESVFGDYMQLPPEDKRKTAHSSRAWWKTPASAE